MVALCHLSNCFLLDEVVKSKAGYKNDVTIIYITIRLRRRKKENTLSINTLNYERIPSRSNEGSP